jgi:two-component system, cell cycle response regulator CpdR
MAEPHTILFVEDDTPVRESTALLLAAKGFHMLVAPNACAALYVLAGNEVDVLFTDIVMPDMNGIELARHAKMLHPDLKIMFITGYYSRAAEAERLGRLLFKPIRGAEVERELGALLAT